MEVKSRITYTLSKEEIETACYSAYVRKLEELKVNAWFSENELKFFADTSSENGEVYNMRCELEIYQNSAQKT